MKCPLLYFTIFLCAVVLYDTVESSTIDTEVTINQSKNIKLQEDREQTQLSTIKQPETYEIELDSSHNSGNICTCNRRVVYESDDNITIDSIEHHHENCSLRRKIRSIENDEEINEEEGLKYRLPKNIIPKNYTIKITPHMIPGDFTFDGFVEITTQVVQSDTEIVLHVDNIIIKSVNLETNGSSVQIANMHHDEKHQFLRITAAKTITSGSQLIIKVKYLGYMNEEKRGLYRNFYIDKFNQTKWFAVTHLVPTGARKMFPCFDEPALRATFQLNVSRTADFKAISVTKLNATIKENDRYLDVFEKTSVISTYSVALALSEFSAVNEVLNYFDWTKSNPSQEVVMSTHRNFQVFKYYEEFWKNMNQLENWNLVAYNDNVIITNPKYVPVDVKQAFAQDMVRHSGYGYYVYDVSPKWWNNVWFSTGFSNFFVSAINKSLSDPYWDGDAQFTVDNLQPLLLTDAASSSHSMDHDVYSPDQIINKFDDTKGVSVIRMMKYLTEVAVFRDAVNYHYNISRNHSIVPDGFYSTMQTLMNNVTSAKINISIKAVTDSWVTQAGFPVVHVKIDKSKATLSQERFLFNNPDKVPTDKLWWIPITWTSSLKTNFADTKPKYCLNRAVDKITVDEVDDNGWIVFNIRQSGSYRVNYDKQSWTRLIKALKSPNFSKIERVNRAVLLDDLLNLARAGYVNYATALPATQYLTQETDYIPWKAAFNNFAFLDKQIVDKNIHDLFKNYVLKIMEPIYKKLGFVEKSGEGYFDLLLRANIIDWACKYGNHHCIENSLRLFNNWKSDSSQLIPVNHRANIFCTAVKYGPDDNWEYLWNKYLETNYQTEKVTIIKALACTKNDQKLRQLLLNTIDRKSGLRYEDSLTVFSVVYSSGSLGVKQTLDIISKHYDDIYNYYKKDYNKIKTILKGLSSQLTTKELVLKFEDFVITNSEKLSPITKSVSSYIRQAIEDLKWHDKYSTEILKFLITAVGDYRIPKYPAPGPINPLKYNIHLKPNLNNFSLDGSVEMHLYAAKTTSNVTIQANKLNIYEIKIINTESKKSIDITDYKCGADDKFIITLSNPIEVGSRLTIFLKYTGYIANKKGGLYRGSYKDSAGSNHWIVATQFEKYGASQAFPCFDKPAFTANFQINIARPNDYHTLSNLKFVSSVPSSTFNGIWDNYEVSDIMPPHNIVFIITDFDQSKKYNLTSIVGNKPNAILTEYLRYLLEIELKVLTFLENYTEIKNPINTDLLIIPDIDVDVRTTWNVISATENELIFNNSTSTTSRTIIKESDTILINKIVNIWLDKLVTPESKNYIWLNKGLAKYLQWLVINNLKPESKLMEYFTVYELQRTLLIDSFMDVNPINNRTINDPNNNEKYNKAVSILYMIHHSFGQEVFQETLKGYLQKYQNELVKPSDLWTEIQIHNWRNTEMKSMPKDIISILMNTWTVQAGYPVVHAYLVNNTLTLKQERFLITGRNSSYNELYWIPITIATKSKSDFSNTSPILWLEGESEIIADALDPTDEWFILNIQQTGLYRVNYDLHNWNKLIGDLKNDSFGGIAEVNRAQIIDDLLNLARAGYISYDLALNATEYLRKEKSYLPWKAFFNAVSFLYERFDGRAVDEKFKAYLLMLIKSMYEELGFEEKISDNQVDKLNRQLILSWACKLNHADCYITSIKLFNEWRENSTKFISPDVKQTVFCTAIKYGNKNDWQFLWEKYLASTVEAEKIMMLKALGCSKDQEIINKYLNIAISSNGSISDKYVLTVFASVYSSGPFGITMAFNFLKDNFQAVYKYFNSWDQIAKLFANVAAKMTSVAQIKEIVLLMHSNEDIVHIKETLNESTSLAIVNEKWYNDHVSNIESWLISRGKVSNTSINNYIEIWTNEIDKIVQIYINDPRPLIVISIAIIAFVIISIILYCCCCCCCCKNKKTVSEA